MNFLDNIKVGETVILVSQWRVEEKYVRRVTTNLVWVEGVREAFSRKTGRDTSWNMPPDYPFIATNTDMRMETAACDMRVALNRITKAYYQRDAELPFFDLSIERIRMDAQYTDSRVYSMEQRIKGLTRDLEQIKAERLAHSERAAIAEAALRELGFTDDDD